MKKNRLFCVVLMVALKIVAAGCCGVTDKLILSDGSNTAYVESAINDAVESALLTPLADDEVSSNWKVEDETAAGSSSNGTVPTEEDTDECSYNPSTDVCADDADLVALDGSCTEELTFDSPTF